MSGCSRLLRRGGGRYATICVNISDGRAGWKEEVTGEIVFFLKKNKKKIFFCLFSMRRGGRLGWLHEGYLILRIWRSIHCRRLATRRAWGSCSDLSFRWA